MISSFLIPMVLFYIIGYGLMNREKVYDIFIDGVKEGFKIVVGIAPTPLILVRMFSTSAANGLVFDLFKEYGTDSDIGLIASVFMSCTESIFYIMSVYLLAVNVKKSRWTLAGGILATLAGVVASVVVVRGM